MDAIPPVPPHLLRSTDVEGEVLSGDTWSLIEAFLSQYTPREHSKPSLLTTLHTLSVRMGIDVKGLNLLMDSGKKLDSIQYEEIFFNSSKMLENIWEKEVIFITPKQLGYFEVKLNPQTGGNVGEYISYPKERSGLMKASDVVAKFRVTRTIVTEDVDHPTWKAYIDEVTFEDGDPHCVCSFVLEENFTNTELIQKIGLFPIRSKIIEYLYRYNSTMYKQMIESGIVDPKQVYIQCITSQQAQILEDNPRRAIIKGRMYLQKNYSQLLLALNVLLAKFEDSLQQRAIEANSYIKTVKEDQLEASYYWSEKFIYCKFFFGDQEFYVFAGKSEELPFDAENYELAADFISKHYSKSNSYNKLFFFFKFL